MITGPYINTEYLTLLTSQSHSEIPTGYTLKFIKKKCLIELSDSMNLLMDEVSHLLLRMHFVASVSPSALLFPFH